MRLGIDLPWECFVLPQFVRRTDGDVVSASSTGLGVLKSEISAPGAVSTLYSLSSLLVFVQEDFFS